MSKTAAPSANALNLRLIATPRDRSRVRSSATRVAWWPIPELFDVVGLTPEECTRRADINEIRQDGRLVAREVFFGRHELRANGAVRVSLPLMGRLTWKVGAAAELVCTDVRVVVRVGVPVGVRNGVAVDVELRVAFGATSAAPTGATGGNSMVITTSARVRRATASSGGQERLTGNGSELRRAGTFRISDEGLYVNN